MNIDKLQPLLSLWLKPFVKLHGIPGALVGVRMGHEQLILPIGDSALTPRRKMTAASSFPIASQTKMFVASAILSAISNKQLSLREPLKNLLPTIKFKKTGIGSVTVDELLSHRGGVPREPNISPFWEYDAEFPRRNELLSQIGAAKLVATVRGHFKYSNFGYAILGAVLEQLHGNTLEHCLRSEIILPLKLDRTSFEQPPKAKRVLGYEALGPGRVGRELPWRDSDGLRGAAGLFSNVGDLLRFIEALIGGRIVKGKLHREMLRGRGQVGSGAIKYGLGLLLLPVKGGLMYGHSGAYNGVSSATFWQPDHGIGITIALNSHHHVARSLIPGIFNIVLSARNERSWPKALQRYAGNYHSSIWGTKAIAPLGPKLVSLPVLESDPLSQGTELRRFKGDDFILDFDPGFGAVGETMSYREQGKTRAFHFPGGIVRNVKF